MNKDFEGKEKIRGHELYILDISRSWEASTKTTITSRKALLEKKDLLNCDYFAFVTYARSHSAMLLKQNSHN